MESGQVQGLGSSRWFHGPITTISKAACPRAWGLIVPTAPVSCEGTVPFGPTFFHLGVHNLPRPQARPMAADLHAYTTHVRPERLAEILAMLLEREDCLVVLNHALWHEAASAARRTAKRCLPCWLSTAPGSTPWS